MSIKGVDLSEHNGNVNFDALIKDGVKFVILRCGFGQDRTSQDDKQFKNNVEKCKQYGIPYGVYLYSYANTIEKAKSEALHTLRLIKGTKPAYGVWYDVEDKIHPMDKKLLTDIVVTYCEELENAGYYVGVYASLHWFNTRFDDRIHQYDKWVAQWSSKCTYSGAFGIWQFTDDLKIGGKKFDGNYAYKDYPNLTGGATNVPKPSEPAKKKTVNALAIEVINGKWGNGSERKRKLTQSGYDYSAVQKRVDQYYEVAKACCNGDYGNGEERKQKVTKAGYNYKTVQMIVNDILQVTCYELDKR